MVAVVSCLKLPSEFLNTEVGSTVIHTVTVGDVQPLETHTDHCDSLLCFVPLFNLFLCGMFDPRQSKSIQGQFFVSSSSLVVLH